MLWELKKFLDEKEISQSQLAEAAGVSQAWISNFMRGYKTPSVAVMLRIADYLGITLDKLMELVGVKTA